MAWHEIFEATAAADHTTETVRETLDRVRERRVEHDEESEGLALEDAADEEPSGDPMTRVVAGADVLAADALSEGASREAMELVRSHDWLALLASDALLADAHAVVRTLAGDAVANRWLTHVEAAVTLVDHPEGDHPGLATAVAGDTRHVLSLDEDLRTAGAGLAIRRDANVETSVRAPAAFVSLFDPETVYEAVYDETYPGPDRAPGA